ncbi:MAG: molybdopterin molybdotransferase MoeA [Firmicutes bacterium]|nr:molybdopterin molybdotransferase MoeA [Bacillota bacterium]
MSHYISVTDAIGMIRDHLRPISESQPLAVTDALGKVLAEPVQSPGAWPPYARAAMDGYAFRALDTPGALKVVGTLFAGAVWPRSLSPGEALRIMTGAPIPLGADTVLELERVGDGPVITISERVKPGRNIMQAGHEYSPDDVVVPRYVRLTPLHLGQLAALGYRTVPVLRSPRVLLLITGDEVQAAGTALKPGHIYDANGPMFTAFLRSLGCSVTMRHIPDQPQRLKEVLRQASAKHYDLVISTGGVSVGGRDYLPDLLADHFERLFWHVDMHPGKATAAALLAPNLPLIALSGNPGAALTAWYLIVAPTVLNLLHQSTDLSEVRGRLASPYPKPTRETRYLKARFRQGTTGLWFDLVDNQSSDALSSFAAADGLVVIPHGSPPQPQGAEFTAIRLRRPGD